MKKNKNKHKKVNRRVNRIDADFSFIASHELKGPPSAMKWSLDMLIKGDLGELDPRQKEVLEEIYRNNERMIQLLDSITDASFITKGKVLLHDETLNLVSAADDVISQMTHFAKAKNVILRTHVEAAHDAAHADARETPFLVRADRKRLQNTIDNFVNNAIKYTHAKGKVDVYIKKVSRDELKEKIRRERLTCDFKKIEDIKIIKTLDFVLFEVKDTGIGIPQYQQKRVFSKFFRGDNAIKMNTSGIGLGLFVDNIFVQLSGGVLWFTSLEGKGSQFGFVLPLFREKR